MGINRSNKKNMLVVEKAIKTRNFPTEPKRKRSKYFNRDINVDPVDKPEETTEE